MTAAFAFSVLLQAFRPIISIIKDMQLRFTLFFRGMTFITKPFTHVLAINGPKKNVLFLSSIFPFSSDEQRKVIPEGLEGQKNDILTDAVFS
jgi:hypothetical protein